MQMVNEITIRLPDETVNYLQRLDYEIAGLNVLHTHALNAGVALEKRMEIRREYQEVFAEYQMAKNEMWAEFAPQFPNFRRWRVDFQTGVLHVEVTNSAKALPLEGGGCRGETATGEGEEGSGRQQPCVSPSSVSACGAATFPPVGGRLEEVPSNA